MELHQDPAWLDGFRQGDAQALEQIYLQYAPRLFRFLRRRLRIRSQGSVFSFSGLHDPVEAETLVQETFVRAFSQTARRNYDGQREFFSYIQQICRNLILQWHRKLSRCTLVAEPVEESHASGDVEPKADQQALLEDAEFVALLQRFVETLSPREKEVFEALYDHEESQAQAAERLGIGRMQVRTSLKRIRQALLSHLQHTGYAERQQEARGFSVWLVWLCLGIGEGREGQ